jgi:hypothetical protein
MINIILGGTVAGIIQTKTAFWGHEYFLLFK